MTSPGWPGHPLKSGSLSRLFSLTLEQGGPVSEHELAELFEDVLKHPCAFAVDMLPPEKVEQIRRFCEAEGVLSFQSLRSLLCCSRPPIELLYLLKEFAKACRMSPGGDLPDAVASALYFLTTGLAKKHYGELQREFSSISDADLRSGIDWFRAQPWIDPALKQLLD